MQNCPFCEGEISETAKKCRHCGEWVRKQDAETSAPEPPETSRAKEILTKEILPPGYFKEVVLPRLRTPWTLYFVGIGIIVLVLGSLIDANMRANYEGPLEEKRIPEPTGMRYECQELIKLQLTNPRSADFSGAFDRATRSTFDEEMNEWLLIGWVEAENAFGGTVRQGYICHLSRKDGQWTIVDLILNP